MSANDEYDDLDDLLGDTGIQDEILSKPPGSAKDGSAAPAAAPPPPGGEGASAEDGAAKTARPAGSKPEVADSEPEVADLSALKITEQADQEIPDDDAIAEQLKGGIEDLLEQTQGDPETQKIIEALIGSLQQAGGPAPKQPAPAPRQPAASEQPPSFEDTISATMNRLNESQKPGPDDQGTTDFMERMLRELQNSAAAGEGGGLEDLLTNMMSEISSKAVLYEPMKEMHDKFPDWFASKSGQLGEADLQRYKKQQTIVAEIVETYEAPGYSDDNATTREFIAAKMEEMQNTGAPPEELVGDVAGGSLFGGDMPDFGKEGPPMPSECATQ